MKTSLKALAELLKSIFVTTEELKRWLRQIDRYMDVVDELSSSSEGLAKVAHEAAVHLAKRGLVDAELFSALEGYAKQRHDDIAAVAEVWANDPARPFGLTIGQRGGVGRRGLVLGLIALVGVTATTCWYVLRGDSTEWTLIHPVDGQVIESGPSKHGILMRALTVWARRDPSRPGTSIRVYFELVNTRDEPVQLTNTFLAVRSPSGAHKDGAPTNDFAAIPAKDLLKVEVEQHLNESGLWTLWPCYQVPIPGADDPWEEVEYCPERWEPLTVPVK